MVCSIIAIFEHYLSGQTTDDVMTENVIFVFCAISVFLALYLLWIFTQHAFKSNSLIFRISNIGIFLLINTITIIMTGGADSRYKYLLLLSSISATIEGSIPLGLSVSGISSALLFFLDLFLPSVNPVTNKVNVNFENDIILSCTLFLITYLIGYCISTKQQYINNLTNLVSRDELTSLYNYRHFRESIETMFNNAVNESYPLCLAIIDIDWFKSYNDVFGHNKANDVLKTTGQLILDYFPDVFVCARYGGEEFAIIMPNTTIKEAYDYAEKFRSMYEHYEFEGESYLPHGSLTVSIGIAEITPKVENTKILINNTDEALFRAKFIRRNTTEIYKSFADELSSYITHLDGKEIITTIKTLIAVINSKDMYTYRHSDGVFHYCETFADYLHLSPDQKKTLVTAAYMHDIGKIHISKDILMKPSQLTEEEFKDIQTHPDMGADIIQNIPELQEECRIVRQHHERYDGNGYPQKLKGEEICYLARILSIADCYEAMTSKRPYKQVMTPQKAKEEIFNCGGTQFDPILANQFVKFLDTVIS